MQTGKLKTGSDDPSAALQCCKRSISTGCSPRRPRSTIGETIVEFICEDCGARYADAADSCARRFDLLLALDHSREEPWGSRHGLAFAVFALQHPRRFPGDTSNRALETLTRVIEHDERLETVVREMRALGAAVGSGSAMMVARRAGPFPVTIADLGDFAANDYAARLDEWCRATLAHLRIGAPR